MNRRQFIARLASSAVVGPQIARAQQAKLFRIGYLEAGARSDPILQNLRRQLLLGLRDLGHIEDRHFRMEDRNAEGQLDRLPGLAAELVNLSVDVIVAGGEAPVRAAKQATSAIPIVMSLAADPVGSGLVTSLAKPGGNITGMSALASDMAGKRVELLKELIPAASRVAVLWNPNNQSKVIEWKDTQTAAQSVGLALYPVEIRSLGDFTEATASIMRGRPDALLTFTESLTLALRAQIGQFALANRLPMVSELREFVSVGGLASYGTSRPDLWRRSAAVVDKIMRGAKPEDLPIEQPTRFELVINLKSAQAMGFVVHPTMLTRADEVIE
jgi:putative ABC transport system substrate-binding protein